VFKRLLQIDRNRKKSFFLFGPRGTGKTSWVTNYFPEALYIDLLKTSDYTTLQADPSRLEKMVLSNKDNDWVIIDEVQKVPQLLDEVHRLIEKHNKYFILTGSSARKLKREGVNLLAGRALTYKMHPLTIIELGDSFNLETALTLGMLPLVYMDESPGHFLETYVLTYLREEVIQEGLVRNVGSFNRFMEVASFSQGSQINLSSVAREVGVSQKVVTSYFEILEDLLLSVRIPVFTKRAKRRLSLHPKFYYFDVGVYRKLRPKGPLDIPEEIGGAAFETLFLQHLLAVIDYFRLDLQVYFWRTTSGAEVDFIVYGESGLFAFELKSRANIESRDLTHLKSFKTDYDIAQCYLVYAGDKAEQHKDIQVIPIKQALMSLPSILGKSSD
jgi:uncharacterized protein